MPNRKYRFEIVSLRMIDLGLALDLEGLARDRAFGRFEGVVSGRDTPYTLSLPKALVQELVPPESAGTFESVGITAKFFADGVLSLETKACIECPFSELESVDELLVVEGGLPIPLEALAKVRINTMMGDMEPYIDKGEYALGESIREAYRLYCLVDVAEESLGDGGSIDSGAFVREHRAEIAALLMDEPEPGELHDDRINETLESPFSYNRDDIAIFDYDRAFVISPRRDYSDIMLMVEHANYQLLELRALDALLGRWIREAEGIIRPRKNAKKKSGRKAKKANDGASRSSVPPYLNANPYKSRRPLSERFSYLGLARRLAALQPIRLDALFILEKLENSSRIIGDYYLGEVYKHLCKLYRTPGWQRNVERRIDSLQSLMTISKSNSQDRAMLFLELAVAVMIAIELVIFFFQ